MSISILLGIVLVLSGLGVLAVLKLVTEKQRILLRSVAWFDIVSGLAVVVLGYLKILP